MNKIRTVVDFHLLQKPEPFHGSESPGHDGLPPPPNVIIIIFQKIIFCSPPDVVVHGGVGLVAGAAGGQGGDTVTPETEVDIHSNAFGGWISQCFRLRLVKNSEQF